MNYGCINTISTLHWFFFVRITNAILKRGAGGTDSNGQFDASKYDGFEWMKNIEPKMIELIENEV